MENILRQPGTAPAGACAAAGGRCILPGSGPAGRRHPRTREETLDNAAELDAFLRGAERRAYVMAVAMTGNRDEALDVVQDAMLRFVRRYAARPAAEWPALFFTIVANRGRDWGRHRAVRNRVLAWFRRGDEPDPVETAPGPPGDDPQRILAASQGMEVLGRAVRRLPARQREAFALRCLEGLDVAATARAMGCSEGSVKTHYSRALAALRAALEGEEP